MRRIIYVLGVFYGIPLVWAAPDTTMTITPAAVSGTTITASDENARNNTISTAYNSHNHTGTSSSTFVVGQGSGTTVTYGDFSARAYNSGALSLTSGTATVLTLDSERWDTDTIHSTSSSTSRLTATTAGKYQIMGSVEFASGSSGQRYLEILLNGATVLAAQDCDSRPTQDGNAFSRVVACVITAHYNLSATNYVELRATQRVASTLNVNASGNYSPEFEMVKVP